MLKENTYQSEKLRYLQAFRKKHLEDTISEEKLMDLLQLAGKEDLKQKALNLYVLQICKQIPLMKFEIKKMMEESKKQKLISFTEESLLKNKLMIWKDRYNLLKQNQQTEDLKSMSLKLSQILALELILTKKEQTFYWITQCQEQSEMLSLLTKTDYQDLDLIYSKQLLSKEGANLQFLTTLKQNLQNKSLLKTCSQSFISSHVSKWGKEATKTENVSIKTLKFRIYPSKEQKEIIKDYANSFKYVYNKTIKFLQTQDIKSKISKIDLRDILVTEKTRKYSLLWNKCNSNKSKLSIKIKKFKESKNKNLKDCIEFILNTQKYKNVKNQYDFLKTVIKEKKQELTDFEKKASKELRTVAVNEAFTSWRTNCDLFLQKRKCKFTMKYKTKKQFNKGYTFGITPQMYKLKDNKLYLTDKKLKNGFVNFGKKSIKSLDKITETKQSEIIYKNKKYYIHLCVCLKKENKNTKKIQNVIGLDPGVATFLSGFGTKETVKYQQSDLLDKINKKMDKIKASKNKVNTKPKKKKNEINQNKKSKRRVLLRLESKKSNLVDNLHWNVINDLCANNEIICIERFNSKQCVESNKLSKFSKRRLNDFKHFQFRQRLKFKANNQGIEVIEVNPHMTSKFCSSCGAANYSLKLTDRIYECSNCDLKICRDLNACKNILMFGLATKI